MTTPTDLIIGAEQLASLEEILLSNNIEDINFGISLFNQLHILLKNRIAKLLIVEGKWNYVINKHRRRIYYGYRKGQYENYKIKDYYTIVRSIDNCDIKIGDDVIKKITQKF